MSSTAGAVSCWDVESRPLVGQNLCRDSAMTGRQSSFEGHRIGLAGPMLGGNQGWVTSQHEVLAGRFAAEGAAVLTTSSEPRRVPRLVDTIRAVNGWAGRVDVILIAVFSGPGFWIADATSRLARQRGIPQVLILHGGNLPRYVDRHPRRARACFNRADIIVAPSPYLADEVPTSRRICVIPNVFDLDGIQFQERSSLRPRLLWMRTFHPIYNPLLALEVLAQVRARRPGATLTMAGQEKGLLRACQARAHALGVGGAVAFPGFLNEEQKRQAFIDHDVFLNTNDVDNTPVSVLEAAAAGLPIVATAVGGIPYLFESGSNALLGPAGDASVLSEAVLQVLSDDKLARRLSVAGRALAEQSAWESVRLLWLDRFRDLERA